IGSRFGGVRRQGRKRPPWVQDRMREIFGEEAIFLAEADALTDCARVWQRQISRGPSIRSTRRKDLLCVGEPGRGLFGYLICQIADSPTCCRGLQNASNSGILVERFDRDAVLLRRRHHFPRATIRQFKRSSCLRSEYSFEV